MHRPRTPSRPAATRLLLLGLLLVLALPVGHLPGAGAATLEVGYRDHTYAPSVSRPTAQKPQSKLWHADGTWWGVLWDEAAGGYAIHRFDLARQDTAAWTSTGVRVDVRPNSQADVLWDEGDQKLYVLTHLKTGDRDTADKGLRFVRFGYDGTRYTHEVSHTVANVRTEAAVLDRDSTGRLWVTWTGWNNDGGGRLVKLAHTTTSDTSWTAPYTLPVDPVAAATHNDDISTVVAYRDTEGDKVGVLWSNQNTSSLYFASHVDGAPDTAWSLTALCAETYCPDDHLNVKSLGADPSGHLYAVIKTSNNDRSPENPDDPLIEVFRLDGTGSWSSSTAWTVAEGDMTRPIVVLDSENRRVHAFAVGPCCDGGSVFTKSASFDDLDFPRGDGTVFMRSAVGAETINNPTSTKQPVDSTTGLLVLAGMDSTRHYVHNYLPLDGGGQPPPPDPTEPSDTQPPTVTSVTPGDGATGVQATSTVTASFSEPLDASTVGRSTFVLEDGQGARVEAVVGYDEGARRATLAPVTPLVADTGYTARVVGGPEGVTDLAGNALAGDHTWQFRTAAPAGPGGDPDVVSVEVTEDSWVNAGRPTRNYGAAGLLNVDARPVAVTYLKFDLSAFAGRRATAATLTVRVTSSGSAGSQAVRASADDTWTELGVTYADRPALGEPVLGRLGATGRTLRNTTYAVPLDPAALTGELGGTLTLGLDSASTDGVDLGSRESGWPAALELTLE